MNRLIGWLTALVIRAVATLVFWAIVIEAQRWYLDWRAKQDFDAILGSLVGQIQPVLRGHERPITSHERNGSPDHPLVGISVLAHLEDETVHGSRAASRMDPTNLDEYHRRIHATAQKIMGPEAPTTAPRPN